LAVFAAFSLVVGIGLADNHVSAWGIILFLIVGIVSLEIGYMISLLRG
jgi:hypothetical protein